MGQVSCQEDIEKKNASTFEEVKSSLEAKIARFEEIEQHDKERLLRAAVEEAKLEKAEFLAGAKCEAEQIIQAAKTKADWLLQAVHDPPKWQRKAEALKIENAELKRELDGLKGKIEILELQIKDIQERTSEKSIQSREESKRCDRIQRRIDRLRQIPSHNQDLQDGLLWIGHEIREMQINL